MKKRQVIVLLSFLLLIGCTKEHEHYQMSAIVNNQNWIADSIFAHFTNQNHLEIDGYNHANETKIYLDLTYTGTGIYTFDIPNPYSYPPSWYTGYQAQVGFYYYNAYTISEPIEVKGMIDLQYVSRTTVKGIFNFEYTYTNQQFNFKVTDGQFVSPVK